MFASQKRWDFGFCTNKTVDGCQKAGWPGKTEQQKKWRVKDVNMFNSATAWGFNVRLWAGHGVPRRNCVGGKKNSNKKKKESDILNVSVTEPEASLCWCSGKAVWCWFSAARRTSGLSGERSMSPGLDTRAWRGKNVTVRLMTRICHFSFFTFKATTEGFVLYWSFPQSCPKLVPAER